MADKKVSELTAASLLNSADILYVVQSGVSKSISAGTFLDNLPQARFKGNVAYSSTDVVSSPGVIAATKTITKLEADVSGGICTLATGAAEQLKMLMMTSTAGGTITVSGLAGNANVYFSKVGHTASFLYTSNVWYVIGGSANIVLP